MAKKDINPDLLAKKTFLMTVVGAILYISVVFAFVIGGNRREEDQQGGDKTPEIAGSVQLEHHP